MRRGCQVCSHNRLACGKLEADRGDVLLHNGLTVACIPRRDSFVAQAEGREAVLQVGKLGSTIRFSFDEFEPVDVSFHWPS
jgi:hypothetical protein